MTTIERRGFGPAVWSLQEEVAKTKTYLVSLPVTGIAYVEVEAESKEAAIEKAMEDASPDDLEEWEYHKEIVSGNVFHGRLNKATAEEQ